MRTFSFALALSGLVIGSSWAMAQQASTPAASSPVETGTADLSTPTYINQQSASQLLASNYVGKTVYGPTDVAVGSINDLVFDQSGAVVAAVVGVGGFLGIGEKNIAVLFPAIKSALRDGKEYLTLDATKEQLNLAPNFVRLNKKL